MSKSGQLFIQMQEESPLTPTQLAEYYFLEEEHYEKENR